MFLNSRPLKSLQRRLGQLLVLCLLLPSLVMSSIPTPIAAAAETKENPSREVIAQKLELVAFEKKIPSAILKAIAFKESTWRQWDKNGNVVVNHSGKNPALGIMQVASYGNYDVERLKNDMDYNIAAGADILNAKFEFAPKIGDGDRNKLENWYFALWAYNSWSAKNNPWVAEAGGYKSYQDKVFDLMAREYFPGVVTPVEVTSLPKETISKDALPSSKTGTWATPEPVHYGDLLTNDKTPTERIGEGRIDTAIKIALEGWKEGTNAVVIARSDAFPDVLAGVPFAYNLNAPILLTPSTELDERVEAAIRQLQPTVIYLLGGESALSKEVEQRFITLGWTSSEVRRIAGKDRFETAAQIAEEFPDATEAALVTGLNFPDAMGFAPIAAQSNTPLLLVTENKLPEATKKVLESKQLERLTVIGGEKVVGVKVAEEVAALTGVPAESVKRIAGNNRYETSVAIASQYSTEPQQIDLATGEDFPYALAGAVLTARTGSTLLLVNPEGLNDKTEAFFKNLNPGISLKIYGGEEVVPEGIVLKAKSLLEDAEETVAKKD